MKITAIRAQITRAGRYSIFVDEKYCFSLSDTALLQTGVITGQELTEQDVKNYKQLSDDDKLYNRTLGFIAIRPRSRWEIQFYLERKKTTALLVESILNKLSILGLVDDRKYAQAYTNDRRLLRPTSRRKMKMELMKKRVSEDIIREVLASEQEHEISALQEVITCKRRQTKYQDDDKLMRYLAGQGFGYGDIKSVLQNTLGDD